jgi:hypothetical protein
MRALIPVLQTLKLVTQRCTLQLRSTMQTFCRCAIPRSLLLLLLPPLRLPLDARPLAAAEHCMLHAGHHSLRDVLQSACRHCWMAARRLATPRWRPTYGRCPAQESGPCPTVPHRAAAAGCWTAHLPAHWALGAQQFWRYASPVTPMFRGVPARAQKASPSACR